MLDSFRDTFRLPDLKRRILFTLAALFVYRLGAHVPTPGVDAAALGRLFDQGSILGFLDLFAGGALSRFSIFALGVTPYINSSIVMQLLAVVVPSIEKLQKEGEEGRKKIVQWTRYGTIIFAFIQAVGMTGWLRGLGIYTGSFMDIILVSLTLTTGAVAVMWLGEIMSDHGIGNGISLLIFAGIVVRIPEAVVRTFSLVRLGEMNALVLLLAIAVMLAVVAGCVMLQEGQRRLPVQYAKRMVGNKMYGGQSGSHPHNLRLLRPSLPLHCGRTLPEQRGESGAAGHEPEQPDLHGALRDNDSVLLIFLYRGRFQARRYIE